MFCLSAANKLVNKIKQDKNKVKRLEVETPLAACLDLPGNGARKKSLDARRCTRPLGTPRGRYDAHSGKFPSVRNQGLIGPVGVKKHVEG